jgi:hypothetical protein
MARSRKTEQAVMSAPEVQLLDKTHLPVLGFLDPPELLKLRKQLREIREGAPGVRAADMPMLQGNPEALKTRHALLAAAVKRVNREIEKRRHDDSQPEAARR